MSEAGYAKDEKYQFLLKYFPANKISLRFAALWNDVVTVLVKMGLANKVCINEESFQMFIIDYFTDIARLKDFQDITRVNVSKIYGYELYWFLRRHPVQLLDPLDKNFDVNEKVAIGVFTPKILAEAGIPCANGKQNQNMRERLSVFLNLLFYNIKYRTYTQHSLELMIEAFLCQNSCV